MSMFTFDIKMSSNVARVAKPSTRKKSLNVGSVAEVVFTIKELSEQ